MATMNLDPEFGRTVAQGLSDVLNGKFLNEVADTYKAVMAVGDDNALAEGTKENFQRYQAYYNDTVLPAIHKLQDNFERFTDAADYISKLQTANSIVEEDVGTVTETSYDACKSL